MTDKTLFNYPTHPDGRRKSMAEMTDAEQDAVLAAPVESLPDDIRPTTNQVAPTRGYFRGPRMKGKASR